jgi:hypothetical protein
VQEEVHGEPAEDADVEEKPEEDTNGDDESEVTDLKHLAGPGFSQQQRAPTRVTVPRRLYDIWAGGPATSLGWQHLTADRAKAAFD